MSTGWKHRASGITIAHRNGDVECPVYPKDCYRWIFPKLSGVVKIGHDMSQEEGPCPGCFGRNCSTRFKACGNSWYLNRMASNANTEAAVTLYVEKYAPEYFRVHGSGEFETTAEVRMWIGIAKKFPNTIFYGYSKEPRASHVAQFNLIIHYNKHLNYGTLEEVMEYLKTRDGFICPKTLAPKLPDGSSSITCMGSSKKGSTACYICAKRLSSPIYFVGHGGKYNKGTKSS